MEIQKVNADKFFRKFDEREGKEKPYENTDDSLQVSIFEMLLRKKKAEATELIADNFLKLYNFYTIRDDENSEMWIYDKGIYIPQGKTFIKERCHKLLLKTYSTFLCNQVISKIEVQTYIDQEDFFKEEAPHLIAVQNGVLDVKKKELLPFNPKYKFFNKLPMEYKKEAKCPNVINFFKSTLKDEEEIKVIQELFGFLLYREYFLEKAFMFLGSGRNGKGKTIDLMKRFLGIENCSEISLEDLEKDIFSLGELFKKMANLSGDLSHSALKNTGNFKKLTGRDLISGARKFKSRVSFENYSKMIFACNELPITYDITTAFFNRWIILDFPYTFLPQKEIDKTPKIERDKIKLQKPEIINEIVNKEELEGILVWALDGLERLFKEKSFSFSPSTSETEKKWLRRSDSFQAFIIDELEEDYGGFIIKTDLRGEYHKYCKNHKLKPSGDKAIKYLLATNLGSTDERKKIGENTPFVWIGIKFKDKISKDECKGSKASKGIQSLVKKINISSAEKTPVSPTTLTLLPMNQKNNSQFTPEMIEKSGIDPNLIKKLEDEVNFEEMQEDEETQKKAFFEEFNKE